MLRTFLIFISLCLFFSCSKDVSIPTDLGTTQTSEAPNAEDYYPLNKGNWWVYDYYKIYVSNGTETFWYRDSVWIAGDTIINGYKYTRQEGINTYGGWWTCMRDSSGYMVLHRAEKIYFSCCNFTDTLQISHAMQYTVYQKMIHRDTLITTPVGSFHSISKGYIWYNWNNMPFSKKEYLFFAKGIGMTQYCHWLYPSCGIKYEGRLVKYHLN